MTMQDRKDYYKPFFLSLREMILNGNEKCCLIDALDKLESIVDVIVEEFEEGEVE